MTDRAVVRRRPSAASGRASLVAVISLATAAVAIPMAVHAAPSATSVTVGVGGAAAASATVAGGPVSGQGDNSLGQPLSPCPPQACESFTINLAAPAGFATGNKIGLAVSTAYDTPPSGSGPGTLDTYLEDSAGNVMASDAGSHNPSALSVSDVPAGKYTLLVAGSTGADNSYTATVTASSRVRTVAVPNSGPPITFSTPTVMSPIESVGEPTIAHSPAADNTVYASGPWGSGTQRSIWYASADGGQTFRLVQQCLPQSGLVPAPGAPCPAPTSVSGTANPPGGGDTDQRLDSTGKDYFADLWALACDRVASTADHGATANQNAVGCTHETSAGTTSVGASDRQWLTVFDPRLTGVVSTAPDAKTVPLIYMEYNRVAGSGGHGGCFWLKSTDGLTYSNADGGQGHYGCDGYPSIDQVTGDVFEASQGKLNIGVPDAGGNLTFLDDTGGNAAGKALINFAGSVGASDTLFPVTSMDTGRNLHVTWTNGGLQVFTTVASYKTGWKTFAPPVQVSAAPATTNVFPWVQAGGPGRSDSVWYGTSNPGDPSANLGQQWYPYMNQVVWPVDADGAVTLAAPTTDMVRVAPHPNHYNSICLNGTGCIASKGDRNLADFFSVVIDHTGAAEVEYNDTTNGLEQAGFTAAEGTGDHLGAPVVTIARQDSGPGLLGTPVAPRPNEPTSAPTSGMSHPGGHALYPVIGGTNVPGLDLVGNKVGFSPDGKALNVTMNVADASATGLQGAFSGIPGTGFLQYVTRWVMCPPNVETETNSCTIYYAMAEATPAAAGSSSTVQFFAGKAQSIDLCSVSACDPHVEYYPESPSSSLPNATGTPETGTLTCPATPSATTPCSLSISVNLADVGSPTPSSLLEEVGTYSFASARPQAAVTNAQAEADLLPLEVDGICCFNAAGAPVVQAPEVPWAPLLAVIGVGVVAVGTTSRRRMVRSVVGGAR